MEGSGESGEYREKLGEIRDRELVTRTRTEAESGEVSGTRSSGETVNKHIFLFHFYSFHMNFVAKITSPTSLYAYLFPLYLDRA